MLFNFLRTSSIWISFVSSFGPTVLCQLYNLPLPWFAPVAVFLTTFAIYSFDKATGSKEDLLNTPERAWLAAYPIKQIALAAYVGAIILVAASDLSRVPAVLAFGLAGWIYTKKICGARLKDILGAKNLIVALATAILYAGLVAAPVAGYLLTFLLIWVDTVIFDLRDQVGDSLSGVRTLPVVLGAQRTVTILTIVDLALWILSPIVGLVALISILYFSTKKPNWQYDLVVDSWFFVIFLLIESIK